LKLKIQRCGNSSGIRFPAQLLKELGVKIGDSFEMEQVGSELRLKPVVTKPVFDIEALAAQCDPAAAVPAGLSAWSTLEPVGRECLA
jgi:antitoxin ChpS